MVRLAIAGEPRFVLDRIELRRRGVSYTLDTVRELAAAEPGTEWVLILGQDQYASLHTWRDWRELLGLVTLAIANRPDAEPAVNAADRARAAPDGEPADDGRLVDRGAAPRRRGRVDCRSRSGGGRDAILSAIGCIADRARSTRS